MMIDRWIAIPLSTCSTSGQYISTHKKQHETSFIFWYQQIQRRMVFKTTKFFHLVICCLCVYDVIIQNKNKLHTNYSKYIWFNWCRIVKSLELCMVRRNCDINQSSFCDQRLLYSWGVFLAVNINPLINDIKYHRLYRLHFFYRRTNSDLVRFFIRKDEINHNLRRLLMKLAYTLKGLLLGELWSTFKCWTSHFQIKQFWYFGNNVFCLDTIWVQWKNNYGGNHCKQIKGYKIISTCQDFLHIFHWSFSQWIKNFKRLYNNGCDFFLDFNKKNKSTSVSNSLNVSQVKSRHWSTQKNGTRIT